MLLVVVAIVDEDCVLSVKTKRQSPVAVHLHGPVAGESPLKRMKVPARHIHFGGFRCATQNDELVLQPLGMRGLDTGFGACGEELFEPGVTERANHKG